MPVADLLRQRRRLLRELRQAGAQRELRIAVLGANTTAEVVQLLEILLLSSGFDPVFFESGYGRFYEEAVHDSGALIEFRPELVYVQTSYRDVLAYPPVASTEEQHREHVDRELASIGKSGQAWLSMLVARSSRTTLSCLHLPCWATSMRSRAVAAHGSFSI